jgi:hypothetical protein
MNSVFISQCDLGRGLFAGQDFAAGEVILKFTGPTISLADALAKEDEQSNALQIGDRLYIDLESPGVFGNHSCDPNAGIMEDRVLVALRLISRGEEIRYDYSTTMWEEMWTMPCQCGSSRCRSVVRDFPELPAEVRAEYLRLRVVQRFIVRRLRGGACPNAPVVARRELCSAIGTNQRQ